MLHRASIEKWSTWAQRQRELKIICFHWNNNPLGIFALARISIHMGASSISFPPKTVQTIKQDKQKLTTYYWLSNWQQCVLKVLWAMEGFHGSWMVSDFSLGAFLAWKLIPVQFLQQSAQEPVVKMKVFSQVCCSCCWFSPYKKMGSLWGDGTEVPITSGTVGRTVCPKLWNHCWLQQENSEIMCNLRYCSPIYCKQGAFNIHSQL